jgi:hypothetical protein
MPRQKIPAANTESPEVAQETVVDTIPVYYEYIIPRANSVLLTRHEWARGLGLADKDVKKAQAARHREVAKGFARTEEA